MKSKKKTSPSSSSPTPGDSHGLLPNKRPSYRPDQPLPPRPAPTAAPTPASSPIVDSTARLEKLIHFRDYQRPIFRDRETGVLVLHWSRQIGKSYALAAWAVDRLFTRPGRLVTVLSNSRDNGAEFIAKAAEICSRMGANFKNVDDSPNVTYENMRMELRITVVEDETRAKKTGRLKVLAANPRTARGFSGDLILDEFAFHENSLAIWEAAEPILSSNSDFLCRIASTGNGKHNLFYRMAAGHAAPEGRVPRVPDSQVPDQAVSNDGTIFTSASGFRISRVTRTAAHAMGVNVYDPNTRQPITPAQARAKALDKRAYDQNYECLFNDENACLLTHELIQSAERPGLPIDHQEWSPATLARLSQAEGELTLGGDIGRHCDLTVFAVLEKSGATRRIIALLRLSQMRLPAQQAQLDLICALPKFRRACIDMTGLGLGLVEYAQEKWGLDRILGVNFASTEPVSRRILAEGRRAGTARVTEIMATDLLAAFEEKSLELHIQLDADAIADLRKPEKLTSPGGRVSIAATRDEAGHADHFWSLALALRAATAEAAPGSILVFENTPMSHALAARWDRVVMG